MKIGIDLDGVLFDSERYYRARGELFDIENGGKGELNYHSQDVCAVYDLTGEKRERFLDLYLDQIQLESPFMSCAVEVIKKLQQEGHKLVIITARGALAENEIDISMKRFEEAGLKFDGLFFRSSDKAKVCQDEKVDVMIDDNLKHIKAVAAGGIKCLFYRELWVEKYDNENVIEVKNWGEIYRNILKLSGKI